METQGRLSRQNGEQVEVYAHVRRGRYKHIRTSHSGKMRGDMATVEEGTPGTKKVCSVAPPPIRPIPPTDFLDVLRRWGQTWIWDDLTVTGGTNWFAQAIVDNSLVAVTNGSYIKDITPSYVPWPSCWNAPWAGANWPERMQRHQRQLMHIAGNSWG